MYRFLNIRAWFSRIEREWEAGNLKIQHREVLKALGQFGQCRFGIFPSHALLALRARCSVRTVQRALEAARTLGLVEWSARRVRVAWRSLRASNRYVLKLPAQPAQVGGRQGPATTGQRGRGVPYERKKEAREGLEGALVAMVEGARRLPDLLNARLEHWRGRFAV
jgi:hypothetical protein